MIRTGRNRCRPWQHRWARIYEPASLGGRIYRVCGRCGHTTRKHKS